jgi:hypothetical protein
MKEPPRIALFVEGSVGPHSRRSDPLARIWQEVLVRTFQLYAIHRIIPISKKNLVSMDRSLPRSGAAFPLDELMLRELEQEPFDLAVVAWDVVPSWAP